MVIYAFRNNEKAAKITNQSMIVYFVLTIGLILLLSFVPMPSWMKLLIFTIFAVVIAGLLHSTSRLVSKEFVDNALKGTIAIFIIMSVLGVLFAAIDVDLTRMQLILFAGLIGLIVAMVLVLAFSPTSTKMHKILLLAALVLFSCFVIVYTNVILQPGYTGTSIDAAVGFYIDFTNIFSVTLGLETL